MKAIRIGLLGAGAMGAEHAYCYGLIEGAQVAGVFSRDLARATAVAKDSGALAVGDPISLIDDPTIDAIDVCLPSAIHAPLVVRALEGGKHVFCETPVALDMAEARRMRDAARQSGRLLQVGLLCRSIGACVLARRAVDTGEYGRLRSVRTSRYGSYLRVGAVDHKDHYSDPSTELMTFDFDLVGWLMGPPDRLTASAVRREGNVEEISAVLEYGDGRCATVLAGGVMPEGYPFRVGFQALFEDALIESDVTFAADGPPRALLGVFTQAGQIEPAGLTDTNPYQVELERFVCCVKGTADPALLDVERALEALRLSLATQLSLNEHRWVEVA
jgi:UDP-N-acetylglucosamine 3-dehydrogenase